MKKIAFISTVAWNYFFPGSTQQAGGNTRIYNLCIEFAKKNEYRVYCITGDFGQPDIVEKDRVCLVKAPVDRPEAVLSVMKTIHRIKPDLLIDCCASPRLLVWYLAKKLFKVKYVFLTGSDNDVNGDYQKVENRFFYLAYCWGLKHSDAVISQVPFHKKMLKEKYKLDSNLVLSPYLKIKPHTPKKKETILWVGRAAYYKKPDLFVLLANIFKQYRFVMICNPSAYDNGFMMSYQKEIKERHNLEFHDYVPYPEMNQYYKSAKVLINTSDFEGFSNTFIEAAINYTPVLSLNSNPNGMFSEHGCGYVCHGDFGCLKNHLQKIMQDDILASSLGRHIFNYAFKFHQLDDAVRKIDHIFQGVL